jgi:hypothetical protein
MNDVNRIGQEIQKGHAETNAKINHQAYLHLTDQEDYINPHTHQVERRHQPMGSSLGRRPGQCDLHQPRGVQSQLRPGTANAGIQKKPSKKADPLVFFMA